MHGRIRQMLLIGVAALILAAITGQWLAGFTGGSERHSRGRSFGRSSALVHR